MESPEAKRRCGGPNAYRFSSRSKKECDMMREKSIPYLPTADEIRAASQKIRSGWSPKERESRCVGARAARKLVAMRRLMFDVERQCDATEPCSGRRLFDAANISPQPVRNPR
jgi:hypothetical protein